MKEECRPFCFESSFDALPLEGQLYVGEGSDKFGRKIDLVFYEDVRAFEFRGFKIDKAMAFRDNQKVGEITVEWISEEWMDRHYLSVVHFAAYDGMQYLLTEEMRQKPLSEFTNEEKAFVVRKFPRRVTADDPDSINREFEGVLRREMKVHWDKWQRMKERVGVAHVYFVSTDMRKARGMPECNRGQGIAPLLYCFIAQCQQKRGRVMRSSTLQSPDAEVMWGKFVERGLAFPHTKTEGAFELQLDAARKLVTCDERVHIENTLDMEM